MKSHLFAAFLLLFAVSATAQIEFYGKNIPNNLKETTLAVVMSGSESYQVELKNAVEQYWKQSAFEFIDESTFEKYKSDPAYSFLLITGGEVNGYPTRFFTLAMGNKKKSEQPLILKQLIVDESKINTDGAPMVHLYVQHIQRYINAVADGTITDRTFSGRLVSDQTYRAKEMPMLAKKSDLDATIQDAAKREEFFRGEMEIVSQERINTAILENESVSVVDVILTGERRNMFCYKRVYDASTGEMLYREDTESLYGKKQGLIDSDLKSISRAR